MGGDFVLADNDRELHDLLEMVELPGVEDNLTEDLSIGMKRRVALARAIATSPEYIFYDEPTTGLDPITTDIISDLFLDLPLLKKLTFAGCGLYILTYAFYADWILKGLEKFQYLAVGNFVCSLTFLVSILLLVKSGNNVGLAAFLWSFSFLMAGISIFFVLKVWLHIDFYFC